MEGFLSSIRRTPQIVRVAVNQGKSVMGSFVDPEWVLHYIAEGNWLFELESKSYSISRGDMVLIPPHLLHVVRPRKGKKLVQWVVHFNLFDRPFRLGDFPYAVQADPKLRPKIREHFTTIREAWIKELSQGGLIAPGSLLVLLGYYANSIHSPKFARPREGVHWGDIERAILYIQEAYVNQELDLTMISRAANLSPNYLCRVFKNCLGVPVMKYVTTYRIQKAEEFLLNSSMNCSEMAEAIGFEGIHIFSRLFRKYKGMPPTSYRATHRG